MKTTRILLLVSVSIVLVAAGSVGVSSYAAEIDAAAAKSAVAGAYSCGFDSTDAYQAPGTNASVNVSGVFTLAIGKDGSVSGGDASNPDATFSVDDSGAGPAVCSYSSVSGSVTSPPVLGSFGSASLNFDPANGNSPLCPPGDGGSIAFSTTRDGLKFAYTNSAGFVGIGSCEIEAVPKAAAFQCTYAAKQTGLKDGVGLARVTFVPKLAEKVSPRLALIEGKEVFPELPNGCTFLATGGYFLRAETGDWQMTPAVNPVPPCPATLFQKLNFKTGQQGIFITAPGISDAQCDAANTLTNNTAKLEADPNPLNFGPRAIGHAASAALTLKNTGMVPVTIGGSLGPADPFGAPIDLLDCGTIPVGGSCTVHPTFTPTRGAGAMAILTIISDAGTGKLPVKLKGSGQ